MNLQVTKWGTIQPVYAKNGVVKSEIVTFHSDGNRHNHDRWEICTVIQGSGQIITANLHGDIVDDAVPGVVVKIPPNTDHWMEFLPCSGKDLVILIAYVDKDEYQDDN